MKKKKKMAGLLAVLFLVISIVMPVQAATTQGQTGSEEVNNARNGVLQVNLSYIDRNSAPHVIQGGTGFLIGDKSGAEYMITNYHVVNMDSDTKKAASERFNVDFNNSNNINMQIQVVVKRDVVINATVVNQSSDMDFAILRLEQVIYDRTPLPIDDDDNDLVETMDVYALGFPSAIELVEDAPFYVSSDVNIINGIVSTKTSIDGIKYIRHGATMTEGNSGGPLVNDKGAVVGVNTMGVDDTYFYSLQISEVTAVLKALGISYTSAEDSDDVVPSEDKPDDDQEEPMPPGLKDTIDKTALSALMSECEAMDLSKYDDVSSSALKDSLANGQMALDNAYATQEDIDAAAAAIKDAKNALVEKKTIPMVFIIVIIALIVAIIIVIVVMASRKKKTWVEPNPMERDKGYPYSSSNGGNNVIGGGSSYGNTDSQNHGSIGRGSGSDETSLLDSGSEETSLLGSDETSLLGGGVPDIAATLVRMKNGEQIQIRKQLFKIGKERVKVDYCISDNNTVSRVHVQITYRNNEYYLTDMKSTNYTSVNGNKLSSGQEIKLHNGDKIKLSDEEFEFRC